jgi:hypothetical protein
VRSGDTFRIASRLGVSTKDLQQWNNMRGSGLKVGQNLVIGAGSSARLANNSDSITYRVRKGDSVEHRETSRREYSRCDALEQRYRQSEAWRSADAVCEKQRQTRLLIFSWHKKGTDAVPFVLPLR